MKMVESKWDSYERLVIADGAGLVQIEETKKAFYAGVATMFEIATNAPSLLDNFKEFEAMMQGIDKELEDFLTELGGGPDDKSNFN